MRGWYVGLAFTAPLHLAKTWACSCLYSIVSFSNTPWLVTAGFLFHLEKNAIF